MDDAESSVPLSLFFFPLYPGDCVNKFKASIDDILSSISWMGRVVMALNFLMKFFVSSYSLFFFHFYRNIEIAVSIKDILDKKGEPSNL